MSAATHPPAKHPRVVLAGPYGHPFHPMVITIPIGAWIASVVFDIGARAADDGTALAQGASWLIAIGVVGALLAAVFGLLDLSVIPRGTKAFTTGLVHMSLNLVVVALFVVSFLLRQGSAGTTVETAPFALSIVGIVVLAASGWLGGRLAYHYGVRVADEHSQRDGFRPVSDRH